MIYFITFLLLFPAGYRTDPAYPAPYIEGFDIAYNTGIIYAAKSKLFNVMAVYFKILRVLGSILKASLVFTISEINITF